MDDPRVRRMHNFLNAHGFNIHPHYVAQALAAADRVSEDRAATLETALGKLVKGIDTALIYESSLKQWLGAALDEARAALAGLPGPQNEKPQ